MARSVETLIAEANTRGWLVELKQCELSPPWCCGLEYGRNSHAGYGGTAAEALEQAIALASKSEWMLPAEDDIGDLL